MTYGRRPTCRRSGCGRDVSDTVPEHEGDIGWCDVHLGEVRATRIRLTAGVPLRPLRLVFNNGRSM